MKTSIYLFAFLLIIISSCKKPISYSEGRNTLLYESEGEINLMSNYSNFVNIATLYIENAKPYEQMVGDVITSAKEATINNNGVELSNIEITNINISDIQVTCVANLAGMNNLLESSVLDLQYFNFDTGNYTSNEIATFSDVNMQSAMVEYNLNATDLTPIMEKKPDRLMFKFNFSGEPNPDIKVTYRITFDYNYRYDERERTK
jgi:spore germination protein GerM